MAEHSATDAPVIRPLVCFSTKLHYDLNLVGSANFQNPRPSEGNLVDLMDPHWQSFYRWC